MSRQKNKGKPLDPTRPVESLTSVQCDERQPSCGTCTRLGKVCQKSPVEFRFRPVDVPKPRATVSGKQARSPSSQPASANQACNQLSHHSDPCITDLDIVRSLQHTERDVFYETHWEAVCLPAVHPLFQLSSASAWKHPILKDALLALSSCNMSRLGPEHKRVSNGNTHAFGPNLVHQTRSQLYYSSAIKGFNSMSPAEHQYHTAIIFTVLILFAYLESSMGNFEGFYCHMQGLATFLMDSRGALGDKHLHGLLIAWQQVRYVVWWARVYFSSLDIQRGLPPVPMPSLLEGCFESMHGRRIMALDIMCESHRLSFQEALRHWGPEIENPGIDHGVYALLAAETRKSDEWLAHLPESEQPIKSDLDNDLSMSVSFQSHDAALNFAYYVAGRIMQCPDALSRLETPIYSSSASNICAAEDWVRLLLGIARGINIQTAISRNSYTIGFSGLFLAVILRCQNLTLGFEIQDWLESLVRLQPTEEGAFPVYQTLGAVKAINHQRVLGREIFGISQPVDDGGGTPKFACYNSQSITSLLLHGRFSESGGLFTASVLIPT
ncbi:hypothetical protein N7492_002406 [Penicillium capsulatum]|uniref:Transcription factor domain-containing protein n=1 Tax=Penicillium capsulatum TaxID=69766 RepID=A0A9W9ILC4_9EURO|nr:hypothetical protein N7492_002406 [Penicillium capsulatum]